MVEASRPSHGQRRQVSAAKPKCVACPDEGKGLGKIANQVSALLNAKDEQIASTKNLDIWPNSSQMLQLGSSPTLGIVQHPHNWAKLGQLNLVDKPKACNSSEDCLTNALALVLPSCITESMPFTQDCVQGQCSNVSSEGEFCFTAGCSPGLVCQPDGDKRSANVMSVSFVCNKIEESPGIGEKCKGACPSAIATPYVPNTTVHLGPPKLLTTGELKDLKLMNRTLCSQSLAPQELELECLSLGNKKNPQCGFRTGDLCAFDAKGQSFCEDGSVCSVDQHGMYRCLQTCGNHTDCSALHVPVFKLGSDGLCHIEHQNFTVTCMEKTCQVEDRSKSKECHPSHGKCSGSLRCLPTPTRDPGGRYVEIRYRCRESIEFAEEGFTKGESQCGPVFGYSVARNAKPHLFMHDLPPDFESMCSAGENITDVFHVLELHEHGELCVFKQGEECGHNLGLGADDICEAGTKCSLTDEYGTIWRCTKEEAKAKAKNGKEESSAEATKAEATKTEATKTEKSRAAPTLLPAKLMVALLVLVSSLRSQASSAM